MIYPLLLCTVASLATGLGGIGVVLSGRISSGTMCFFQAFAAGVMLTVSFAEMLPRCFSDMTSLFSCGYSVAAVTAFMALGWFCGKGISVTADYLFKNREGYTQQMRISLVTTAVMVLHNLPEGMLTIFSGMADTRFGVEMAFAVALHNIPEGMVVASGVLYLTKSPFRAVAHSFFAGISELMGGVVAALVFGGIAHSFLTPAVLAAVGGIMVQTSLKELLPSAVKLSGIKCTLCGIAAGTAVMSLSLYII